MARVAALMKVTSRSWLVFVAAGLRCWFLVAGGFLMHTPYDTLPPRAETEVELFDGSRALHFRWIKRKSRIWSLVGVPCHCRSCRLCPIHVFPDLWQQPDRTVIWLLPPHRAIKEIRRIADLVGLANADKSSWMIWRADRATAMANAGHGAASILCVGAWRPARSQDMWMKSAATRAMKTKAFRWC